MEKLALILIFVFAFQAHAASFPFIKSQWLHIDCGVTGVVTQQFYNTTWFPDNFFIDSGKTKQTQSKTDVPPFMSSLRYFPKGDNNCYKLQLDSTAKYLFRAGFYYGNYDEKSKPPVFNLLLGGQLWANVDTSISDEPIFHELIFQPKNDNISVCLVGIENGGTPFISSLEATTMHIFADSAYEMLPNGTALHLVERSNFGPRNEIIEPWSGEVNACEERLNRYWFPKQMLGYNNYTFQPQYCTGMYYENRPPNSVINTAIGPQTSNQSITFSVKFPNPSPQSTYFVFYFRHQLNQTGRMSNATRKMEIYIDNVSKREVVMERPEEVEVVRLYPVLVADIANVTISPAQGSTLPPLVNGMEVFIAKQLLDEPYNHGSRVFSSSIIVLCVSMDVLSFLFLFNYLVF